MAGDVRQKMVGLDLLHTDQAPFFMRTEFQPLGDIRVAKITGTAADYVRNRQLAQDGNDDLVLIVNLSKPLLALQGGKEIPLRSMDSVLIDCARPATVASVLGAVGHPYQMLCMRVPRAGMLIRAPLAEQQIMVPFEAESPSRLLVSYLSLLSQVGIKQDSNLGGLAGGHVLDLIGLMLGAT